VDNIIYFSQFFALEHRGATRFYNHRQISHKSMYSPLALNAVWNVRYLGNDLFCKGKCSMGWQQYKENVISLNV